MDSVRDGSNDGAEVSAVVIPAIGVMNGLRSTGCGLMHSYHNVAELRQFRGAPGRESDPSRSFDTIYGRNPLPAAAVDLNIEVPDLLAQGIAI